jgi:hypothetical protein
MKADLTQAKRGDLFETRDGRLVEYTGIDPASKRYPHTVVLDGLVEGYTDSGDYYVAVGKSPKDLVKGPLK